LQENPADRPTFNEILLTDPQIKSQIDKHLKTVKIRQIIDLPKEENTEKEKFICAVRTMRCCVSIIFVVLCLLGGIAAAGILLLQKS
jgi:hypothetical protein